MKNKNSTLIVRGKDERPPWMALEFLEVAMENLMLPWRLWGGGRAL